MNMLRKEEVGVNSNNCGILNTIWSVISSRLALLREVDLNYTNILICCQFGIFYSLYVSYGYDYMSEIALEYGAYVPSGSEVWSYSVWVYTFLHTSWSQLLTNMSILSVVGRDVERMYGSCVFLWYYFLASLCGAIGVAIFNSADSVTYGASGPCFAFLLTYFIRLMRDRNTVENFYSKFWVCVACSVSFVYEWIWSDNVDMVCNLASGQIGVLAALLYPSRDSSTMSSRYYFTVCVISVVVAVLELCLYLNRT